MRFILIALLIFFSPVLIVVIPVLLERNSLQVYQIKSVTKVDNKFILSYKCSTSLLDSFCIIKKDTNTLKPNDFVKF